MAEGELIAGGMVKSHVDALRLKVGPVRYDQLLGTLPSDAQEELQLVTPLSWVRIASLERLYGVIARELGTTLEALHVEVASRVVGRAVTSLWRALLNLASNQTLIGKAPLLFKRAYRQGHLVVTESRDGFAELEVRDWPDMSEFALRGFRVGVESVLVSLGRGGAKVTSSRRGDVPTLRIEWTPR